MNMTATNTRRLIDVSADDAKALCESAKSRKVKGKEQPRSLGAALMHVPRQRKAANGARTAPIRLDKLPRVTGVSNAELPLHHLGLHAKANHTHAVMCFTHKTAVLCGSRHQATLAAINTSAKDSLSSKARKRGTSAGGVKPPVAWCAGCVSALAAL